LRADLLGGDLRLVYLLWLMALEIDVVDASEPEPFAGLGPMTGALDAFVNFFQIDPILAEAAAERPFTTVKTDPDVARRIVSAFSDREKTEWLTRLVGDDPHAAGEVRSLIRERLEANAGDHAVLPGARPARFVRAPMLSAKPGGARPPKRSRQGSGRQQRTRSVHAASASTRFGRGEPSSGRRSRLKSTDAIRQATRMHTAFFRI
jgi:hypothetical protein